jgi:hypothetical protein
MSLESILSAFSAPPNYFDRLGIDLSGGEKTLKKCMDNPLDCPYPLTDPVVELSLMGHDMLDKAYTFYGIALVARLSIEVAGVAKKSNSMQTIGQHLDLKDTKGGASLAGPMKGMVTLLKEVGGIANLVYNVLGNIMAVFFALGLVLAYLLPFLPKIYLYFGFISWIMVLVMASFSVFLWSLYLIRFKERRDVIKTAGYHYGVELMFKPTFNLIAVIFAWYFFYVVAFVIGVTMGWVFALPVSGEGHMLREYIDVLFIILMVAMVYFVGLKYCYQLMDDLSGELLEKLGVRNKKVKDELSTLLKAVLYEKAQSGMQSMHKKLSKGDDKQQDLQRLKESHKNIKTALGERE